MGVRGGKSGIQLSPPLQKSNGTLSIYLNKCFISTMKSFIYFTNVETFINKFGHVKRKMLPLF